MSELEYKPWEYFFHKSSTVAIPHVTKMILKIGFSVGFYPYLLGCAVNENIKKK